MLKYKDKFEFIFKKILKNQLIVTNLNNFHQNINYIIYNNYLTLLNNEKNDVIIYNKIYYLFIMFSDILKDVFNKHGRLVFVNSNLYYNHLLYTFSKNTGQYWLLGRYPQGYFSNVFFRNNYKFKFLKKNKNLNLPKMFNKYNQIIFILFYFQKIDNILFIKEIKKFINFLNIDFIYINFLDILKKNPLNYNILNFENFDVYIESTYINFFFLLVNKIILNNLIQKLNYYYLKLFTKLNIIIITSQKLYYNKIKYKKIIRKNKFINILINKNYINLEFKNFYYCINYKKIKKKNINVFYKKEKKN
jgi:hypothetical protein